MNKSLRAKDWRFCNRNLTVCYDETRLWYRAKRCYLLKCKPDRLDQQPRWDAFLDEPSICLLIACCFASQEESLICKQPFLFDFAEFRLISELYSESNSRIRWWAGYNAIASSRCFSRGASVNGLRCAHHPHSAFGALFPLSVLLKRVRIDH